MALEWSWLLFLAGSFFAIGFGHKADTPFLRELPKVPANTYLLKESEDLRRNNVDEDIAKYIYKTASG